jgi:formate dehydrogenase major subunit
MTDTARLAHVILPTTAFGEEKVSFTSTERRIQLAEKIVEPERGLTPAWEQIMRVARLLGAEWTYCSAEEIMQEIGRVVPFYSSASYENLARDYGRQWPCTDDGPRGTPFLFENGSAQKFKFVPVTEHINPIETSSEFPLTLVFGSSLYYWNQNVLVRHSETLKREYRSLFLDYPEGFVELNVDDAKAAGIHDGQPVRLVAQKQYASCTARVTPEVRKGTIFVPYFMSDVERQLLGHAGNDSRMLAVRVEKEVA